MFKFYYYSKFFRYTSFRYLIYNVKKTVLYLSTKIGLAALAFR